MTQDDPRQPGQGCHPTVLRALEHAREQRGSPSLWDQVAARLDSEDRQRDFLSPMRSVLDQIRERVDDETWSLVLDFEWRSLHEIMAGVEVGFDLGYGQGLAAARVDAPLVSGDAAEVLAGRFTDVLGDTEAGPFDVLLTLLCSLRTTVLTAREALGAQ